MRATCNEKENLRSFNINPIFGFSQYTHTIYSVQFISVNRSKYFTADNCLSLSACFTQINPRHERLHEMATSNSFTRRNVTLQPEPWTIHKADLRCFYSS